MPVWRRLSGRRDAPYRALYPRADHQGSERASEAAAEVACAPDRPPQHMVARPAENEAMEGVARRNGHRALLSSRQLASEAAGRMGGPSAAGSHNHASSRVMPR